MQTVNKADENFKKLAAIFPNAVSTTAHAVMKLDVEDGGHRKFIMVGV